MTLSGHLQQRIINHLITFVLIPLLVDDPLWAHPDIWPGFFGLTVLIPLLVDDPLWEIFY